MKILLVTAFSLLLAALTQAQSLSGLPQCAQSCALGAIGGSNCPATNVTCICSSPTFITAFNGCVGTACNATDAAAAQTFGIQYCASAGVTIGSSSAAPATSPSATASATSSATSAPASTTSVPASTTSTSTVVTTTASKTASATVQLFTGAAALLGYSWALLGIGGAVALGV